MPQGRSFDGTLTDANVRQAVYTWLHDEEEGTRIYGHISHWDVSSVTDMSFLFANDAYDACDPNPFACFNQPLEEWDV